MNEETKQFQCTGDCLKCMQVQRQYCASQHSYNSMRLLQTFNAALDSLKEKIDELSEKITTLGNESLLFDPNEKKESAESGAAQTKTPVI